MRMKEYNAYMAKRKLIMEKFNILNIEIVILEYLGNMGVDITKNNVRYLVNMIKRILFDYSMFGREETLKVIRDNQDYLFDLYIKDDKSSVSNLKNEIQLLVNSSEKSKNINDFAISSADQINNNINKLQKQNVSKYILQ